MKLMWSDPIKKTDAAEAGGGYGSKVGSDGGDRREIFIRS